MHYKKNIHLKPQSSFLEVDEREGKREGGGERNRGEREGGGGREGREEEERKGEGVKEREGGGRARAKHSFWADGEVFVCLVFLFFLLKDLFLLQRDLSKSRYSFSLNKNPGRYSHSWTNTVLWAILQ